MFVEPKSCSIRSIGCHVVKSCVSAILNVSSAKLISAIVPSHRADQTGRRRLPPVGAIHLAAGGVSRPRTAARTRPRLRAATEPCPVRRPVRTQDGDAQEDAPDQ